MLEMNGFRKLQERLTKEGWYVGWAELCCQTCAWDSLPSYFDAQYDEDRYLILEDKDGNIIEYKYLDYSKVLFNHEQDCQKDDYTATFSPEEQDSSAFCFDGSEEGIANLTAIIPIIEECGCEINWNKKGDSRPDISWRKG
jgi:hypothetical protein